MQPLDYQQTLLKSFTLGGIGLHSAEYGEAAAHTLYRVVILQDILNPASWRRYARIYTMHSAEYGDGTAQALNIGLYTTTWALFY
jgi:hypothetical protein